MSGEPLRDYWDSCIFLSFINATPGRIAMIDALIEERTKSDPPVEILTSVLSVVEVAFGEIERTQRALSQEVQDAIDELWSPGSPFQLIEMYPAIADDARDLVQQAMVMGRSLQAADAIHLATARRLNADRILTYDDRLLKAGQALGLNVIAPTLRVASLFAPMDDDDPV